MAGAYKTVGVDLPAFTDSLASRCPLVPTKDAQPGDIVLYRYFDKFQPKVKYPHTGLWYRPGWTLSADYGEGVGEHPLMKVPYEVHRPA